MPPLKLGLVGAGAAATELHLPALRTLPNEIAIAGVADLDPSRARRNFRDVPFYDTPHELIRAPEIDAVAILTPPATHAALAAEALRAGKHVFVEKPFVTASEDAQALTAQAAETRLTTAAGHNLRFHRLVRKAKQALDANLLGALRSLHFLWTSPPAGRPPWQSDRTQGGGVVFDLGVHHLDLARYLTGSEFADLTAILDSAGNDDVAASVSGRLANGVLFSALWSKTGGEHNTLRLAGDRATLEFSLYRANSWRLVPAGGGGLGAYVHEAREYLSQIPDIVSSMKQGGDYRETYRLQWLDFANAVRAHQSPACPFADAARNVEACLRLVPKSGPRPAPIAEAGPGLSVVLGVHKRFDLARRTIRHLRAQTLAHRIELILVCVSDTPVAIPDSAAAGFHALKTLALPSTASVAQANAAGTRAASASVVAFAEDHCFPEPDWAAALLDAHARGYAAVGPEVANANPGNVVSWCDYLIGYGPWMSPCRAGGAPFLPGHNSSYKRDVLLEYGERLEAMLDSETVLHYDLAARGKGLYLEPAARSAHVNFAQWGVWIPVQYHCGRVFAGARAANWGAGRKLFYAAASPLIPAVRAARIVSLLLQPGRPRHLIPRLLPALAVGLTCDGFGQMVGYLAGSGSSPARIASYEYDRFRFIRPEDRKAFEEADASA